MRFRRLAFVTAGIMLIAADPAVAFAGISDYLATRAFYIRAPYALQKCDRKNDIYPAKLIRGRSPTVAESDRAISPAHDGIVENETVVDSIDRIAIGQRHAVVLDKSGKYWVVDLDDPEAKPSTFPSLAAVQTHLEVTGHEVVLEGEFRTFHEWHKIYHPYTISWRTVLFAVAVPIFLIGWAVFWVRRRRRAGKAADPVEHAHGPRAVPAIRDDDSDKSAAIGGSW